MKKKIVVKQEGKRLYLRTIDIKNLKPLLDLYQIKLHTTQRGKHTGTYRHYIDITQGFKFLELITTDYIVTFI